MANSCIREVDRIGMRDRRKFNGARPREEARHVISKIIRANGIKIAVEGSKRCSIAAMRKIMKTVKDEGSQSES